MAQAGAASAYPFANDMIRDVVYTNAGDTRDLYAQLSRAYQLSGQADRAAAIQAEFEQMIHIS